MIRPNWLRATSMLLAMINTTLLIGAVALWRQGQTRIHEPTHLATHAMLLPDLTSLKVAPAVTVDVVKLRDDVVFYSRRSFYEPPPPSQAIAAPDYEFAGSMALPQQKRVAFVKRMSDHASRTLHVGDDLDGWRVEGIEALRVILTRADQQTYLVSSASAPTAGHPESNSTPPATQLGPHAIGAMNTASGSPTREMAARTYRPPL